MKPKKDNVCFILKEYSLCLHVHTIPLRFFSLYYCCMNGTCYKIKF